MLRRIAGGGCAAAASWSGYISLRRAQRERADVSFAVGTMDDQIMDSLRSGDLIVFARRPGEMHAPAAGLCLAWRNASGSAFDHAAIVVKDALGRAFVLEQGLAGAQLVPYARRITYSRANEIVVVRLRQELGAAAQRRLWGHVARCVGAGRLRELGIAAPAALGDAAAPEAAAAGGRPPFALRLTGEIALHALQKVRLLPIAAPSARGNADAPSPPPPRAVQCGVAPGGTAAGEAPPSVVLQLPLDAWRAAGLEVAVQRDGPGAAGRVLPEDVVPQGLGRPRAALRHGGQPLLQQALQLRTW